MSFYDLSVIMPVFNGERFLSCALLSILAATKKTELSVEVIIVDNNSTDQSSQIISRFEELLDIKYSLYTEKQNWVASTNFGLGVSKGRYVTFLHQDDLWCEDRLVSIELLIKESSYDIFLSPVNFISCLGIYLGKWSLPKCSLSQDLKENCIKLLAVQNILSVPSVVFLKSLVQGNNPMNEDLKYTADWIFWFDLLKSSNRIRYDYRAYSMFRIHPLSQTAQLLKNPTEMLRQYVKAQELIIGASKDYYIMDEEFISLCKLNTDINGFMCYFLSRNMKMSIAYLKNILKRTTVANLIMIIKISRIHERTFSRIYELLLRHLKFSI